MSLLAFQRALADLAASPDFCRRVRADANGALAAYELTPLEHRRVAAAAAQPGMAVNCTLHRSNRSSTILTLLPGTVHLLGKQLRATFDAFWAAYPTPDFTTRREIRRFCAWLNGEIEAGRIGSPLLPDVIAWELAQYELGMMSRKRTLARVAEDAERSPDGPLALHPLLRVVAFRHDPALLIPHLTQRDPLPWDDVPDAEAYLLLDAREGRAVVPLDIEIGRTLHAIAQGATPPDAFCDDLIAEGALVRMAPAEALAAV